MSSAKCPRLRVVPHFSSGIVERAKRARAWKSLPRRESSRKGYTRRVESQPRPPRTLFPEGEGWWLGNLRERLIAGWMLGRLSRLYDTIQLCSEKWRAFTKVWLEAFRDREIWQTKKKKKTLDNTTQSPLSNIKKSRYVYARLTCPMPFVGLNLRVLTG